MFETATSHLVVLLVLIIVLCVAGCAAHYKVHPGAVNVIDSATYDAMLLAQTEIDQARLDLKAGLLPDKAKDPLNALIQSYNLTRDAWLTYRGAMATATPAQSYLDQLNQNLTNLTAAVRALKEVR